MAVSDRKGTLGAIYALMEGLGSDELAVVAGHAEALRKGRSCPDARVLEDDSHGRMAYGVSSPLGDALCDRDLASSWGFQDWHGMFSMMLRYSGGADGLSTFQYVGGDGTVCTDTSFVRKVDAESFLSALRRAREGKR